MTYGQKYIFYRQRVKHGQRILGDTMIKYSDEIIKEISNKQSLNIPDGSVTGDEYEKWLYEDNVMFKNVLGMKCRYGKLMLYGNNVDICKSHIDNTDSIMTVENVYIYCEKRNIRICYVGDRFNPLSLYERFRIWRIANNHIKAKGSIKEWREFCFKQDISY